jgi:hypothetical protein
LRDGRRQRPRSGGVLSASWIPIVERLCAQAATSPFLDADTFGVRAGDG